MAKITIEKIVPAETLIKRASILTRSKKFLILLAVFFIIPILFLANSFLTKKSLNKPKDESLTTTSFQQNLSTSQPESFLKSLPTPPIPFPDTSQITNEFGDAIIADSQDYRIVYYGESGLFSIGIFSLPIETYQPLAEEAFLSTLKISQEKACELNVEVFAPKSPGDKKYKLSFCEF